MPMPKKRLSAASAAFGDGGIHTQWPKIIAKLFIGNPRGCMIAASIGRSTTANAAQMLYGQLFSSL
jgi:hypothetical protein